MSIETTVKTVECIERHDGGCKGKAELRESLSGTGTPIARCEAHWRKRLDLQDRLGRDYPDSPNPPSWFDPSMAGEVWDDSDY